MHPAPGHSSTTLEDLRPRLAPETEILDFSDRIRYLKNSRHGGYLKLSLWEAETAAGFLGTASLSDIIQQQLETSESPNLQKIFDLLVRLNEGRFLADDCTELLAQFGQAGGNSSRHLHKAPGEGTGQMIPKARSGFPGNKRLGWIPAFAGLMLNIRLLKLPLKFSSPILTFSARMISSPAAILGLGAVSMAGLLLRPGPGDVNLLQAFPVNPAASEGARYMAYFLSLFSLWLAFSLVISLRNIFSAYMLSAHGCRPLEPGIRLLFGVAVFDCRLDDIVCAGPRGVIRLYAARAVFPIVLMAVFTLVWEFVFPSPVVLIFKHICLITFFFSLCPFLQTDLNRAVMFLYDKAGGAGRQFSFLRKRFLLEIFSLRSGGKEQNFHIIMSLLGLGWIYLLYAFFWSLIQPSLLFLLSDLSTGPLWGRIFLAGYLGMVLLPPVLLLLFSVLIGLFSLHSVVRSPLHRLSGLGKEISRKKVPAQDQVVSFLGEIPLFSRLEEQELRDLCDHLRLRRAGAGRNIVIQGQKGNTFYVIVSGRAEVIYEGSLGESRVLDVLGTGDSFGEIALVENVPRTATVRTIAPSVFFELDRKYFEEFVVRSAGGKEKITDMIRMGRLVMEMELFGGMTPRQKNALVRKMKSEYVSGGTTIFRQGDAGEMFYIIRSGEVMVSHAEVAKTVFTRRLGRGAYFGEIALIRNIPRTASVSALTDAELLTLTRNEFQEVIRHSLFTGIRAESAAESRLAQMAREAAAVC